jgi:DNA-binding GntR family transcriptional regulator
VPSPAELESFRGETSLYDLLQERCGIEIVRALATIIPLLADDVLARQLEVPVGGPLLLLEQVHYVADGRPVLFSRNTHESRAIQFQVVRMREW